MARRAAAKRSAPDAFGLARRKDIGASAALSLHGFAAVDNTTMLALTDARLARLAIAATAVALPRRREGARGAGRYALGVNARPWHSARDNHRAGNHRG